MQLNQAIPSEQLLQIGNLPSRIATIIIYQESLPDDLLAQNLSRFVRPTQPSTIPTIASLAVFHRAKAEQFLASIDVG